MTDRVLYFFDPICGWCYGFSDHISRFQQEHKDEFAFEAITGGMVPKEHAKPISHMADYIDESYKRIESMSGAHFGEAFLSRVKEGSTVYSSDLPSAVFQVLKATDPARNIEAAKAVQAAIYQGGGDPNDLKIYTDAAAKFGLGIDELTARILSEETIAAFRSDLYTTQQFGVRGFPFAVAELEGEFYLLARGFRPLEELNKNLIGARELHASQREAKD